MKISIYQIDAFTDKIFGGNPAAICPLDKWLKNEILQNIAQQNNLSETAFFVKADDNYHIRWFTPTVEVDLCGHATLACAHVIFEIQGYKSDEIIFHSKSGDLKVSKKGKLLELDFPKLTITKSNTPAEITEALGRQPIELWKSDVYMAVYENESDIITLSPDFVRISELDCLGVIATSAGKKTDFVSRYFAPRCGINEDPVTGSAHCILIPYWADQLGKDKLSATQLSKRGGKLFCELAGERVLIAGHAVKYLEGSIELPDT